MVGNQKGRLGPENSSKEKNHGSILSKQWIAERPSQTKLPASPGHRTSPVCKVLIASQETAHEVAHSQTQTLPPSAIHTVPLLLPCPLLFRALSIYSGL